MLIFNTVTAEFNESSQNNKTTIKNN